MKFKALKLEKISLSISLFHSFSPSPSLSLSFFLLPPPPKKKKKKKSPFSTIISTLSVTYIFSSANASPGWLSGERVGLMTRWMCVRSPGEATFLSGVFSPLTSAEACEKSSRWLWKEQSCVSTGVRKLGNTCVSLTTMI